MRHVASEGNVRTELLPVRPQNLIRYEIDTFPGIRGGDAGEVAAVGVEKDDVATGDEGGEVREVVHGIETDAGRGEGGGGGLVCRVSSRKDGFGLGFGFGSGGELEGSSYGAV